MSQKFTVIEKSAIEYLCSCINKVANVSEGIDDLNLKTNGTFSSVKIDTLLNTLKTDCNEYTDRLVANLSRLELKIANAESEITQPNIMYLYKPSGSTSYEQYVVIEGTKVLLGTCDIDMGNYFTKDEANAKFTLQTEFDALKTKVDGKVDKTSIIIAKDNSATDDQVYSAKAVNSQLDEMKQNFQDGVNTIYDSMVAKGVAPVDKSPSSIADAISKFYIIKEYIPLIPIMTSDTTPSGKVSVSSNANGTVAPYYTFDGTDKYWASKTSTDSWIRYDFDESVYVNKISFIVVDENKGTNTARVKNFRFEASLDGNDWITLYTGTATKDCTNTQTFEFYNKNFYKYYRVYIVDGYSGTVYNSLNYLQFYGYK